MEGPRLCLEQTDKAKARERVAGSGRQPQRLDDEPPKRPQAGVGSEWSNSDRREWSRRVRRKSTVGLTAVKERHLIRPKGQQVCPVDVQGLRGNLIVEKTCRQVIDLKGLLYDAGHCVSVAPIRPNGH